MIATLLSQQELEELIPKLPEKETPLWLYWSEFVEKYLRTGKSEVTVKGVKDGLLFAIRKLGILTIEQLNNPRITEEALHEYKKKIGIRNSTFNSYRKNFNTFCIWLEKMEYIKENRIMKITKCKEEQREHLTFSKEQVKRITAEIHDRKQTKLERLRNTFFIDLIKLTGARPCELLSLRFQDIVAEGCEYKLILQGKKQKGRIRVYPLLSAVKGSFEAYRDYRYQIKRYEEKFFISSSRRTGWTYEGVKKLFAKLSKEVGFETQPYGFRRYVTTELYKAGQPLDKIRDYMGHTRIATTIRYIERSCSLTEACAAEMGRIGFSN